MNVTLKYLTNKHNFDVYQSTPLSYFYKIAAKVFQLHEKTISLLYQNQRISDDESTKVNDFFKEIPSVIIQVKSITIQFPKLAKKKSRNYLSKDKDSTSSGLNRNCLSLTHITPISNTANQSKARINKNKGHNKQEQQHQQHKAAVIITCQLCEKQPSLFYCRNCNEFICLECNTKYSEHIHHQLLQIDNKNYEHTASVYQKDVIREVSILDNAYRKSSEWANIEMIRANCLNGIVAKLKEIDLKAQVISSSKVNKQCDLSEQLFFTIKEYVLQLLTKNKKQKHKELQRVFTDLNKKEKEIIKLIAYVNLEVIKAKYNYKLISILKSIMNMLNELVVLSSNTQNDCALRNYLIEELNSFNDDYDMKPLDYFIAKFDDSFFDGEDLSSFKSELKYDNNTTTTNTNINTKLNKQLLSKFINPGIELPLNNTGINTGVNSNLNLSNNRFGSPPIVSNNNTNGYNVRDIGTNVPKCTVKRKRSLFLNYIAEMSRSGCYSPRKNALNIVFGGANSDKGNEIDLIDSSHVNPYEGIHQRIKKKRSKKVYSNDIFY